MAGAFIPSRNGTAGNFWPVSSNRPSVFVGNSDATSHQPGTQGGIFDTGSRSNQTCVYITLFDFQQVVGRPEQETG